MTKDNIIIAALRLFLLRGYKNVSLIDVAKEVGITKGGIYHYFGSKEELFHAGIGFMFQQAERQYIQFFSQPRGMKEILRFLLAGELDTYLEELLQIEHGDYRANNASLALEIMHNFPEIQARIDTAHLSLRDFIREKLEAAQAAGEVRTDIDTETVATMLLSAASGFNSLGRTLNAPVMRSKVAAAMGQLLGGAEDKE